MNQNEQLYSIQQISAKLSIPKPTLRFWEKEFEGILQPLRTNGGQRRYTSEHISIVEEISALKKTKLSLAEIKRKLEKRRKAKVESQSSGDERTGGIDLLAEKVAEVVKMEILRFFQGHARKNLKHLSDNQVN